VSEFGFAVVLALAWFATVNIAASAVAATAALALDRVLGRARPSTAARVLLGLRLLPGVVSLFFTTALFLPAHWRLEPANAEESAGLSLLALAAVGAVILAATLWRTAAAVRATGWIGRAWLRRSERQEADAGGIPVYRLSNPSPIVSLVGVIHPRLFVSTPVLSSLSAAELDVSLSHELAHLLSGDNLKRVIVACCPDALSLAGIGRRVEDQWRAALEFSADDRAVGGDEQRALNLVSALVTMAKLTPAPRRSLLAVTSEFYDGALLSARIDRLLHPERAGRSSLAVVPMWPVSLAGLALLAALLPSQAVWLVVHLATEGLVRLLP